MKKPGTQPCFYHYTTRDKWMQIQKEGLRPGRPIALRPYSALPARCLRPAIFGLHSPAPQEWLNHGDLFPKLLKYISRDISGNKESACDIVLLKIEITQDDDIWIGDYNKIATRIPHNANFSASTYRAAIKDYDRSMSQLKTQFSLAALRLPEIVCFSPIPADRIRCVRDIPGKEAPAYISAQRKALRL